ncbi:MAG: CheR family methyltransferase [Endomicrobiales bacterium]
MENDKGYNDLVTLIHEKLRLDCREYNESYIRRRVNARLMVNNLKQDEFSPYVKILKANPEELRRLFDILTVNVTQFFRDPTLWQQLARNIFPRAAEEKKKAMGKTLRIWSCGCASGEEPYSLAILLKEIVERQGIVPQIVATDIDDFSLHAAREGVYLPPAFETMPKEYMAKYFRQVAVKDKVKYEILPSVKSHVQFVNHNFLNEPAPAKDFDMVFCRNVIIYFTGEAKDRLMRTFHEALMEHGWLVLGKSEVLFTMKSQSIFYLYNSEDRVYRKERRKAQMKVTVERRKNWWYGYEKTE